jgi:hypothetical protein
MNRLLLFTTFLLLVALWCVDAALTVSVERQESMHDGRNCSVLSKEFPKECTTQLTLVYCILSTVIHFVYRKKRFWRIGKSASVR